MQRTRTGQVSLAVLMLAAMLLAIPIATAQAEPDGDTTVYHYEGKKRVHLKTCRRFKGAEGATEMTFAQAKAKGLPLCSRCPGSTTQGKGNAEDKPADDPKPADGAKPGVDITVYHVPGKKRVHVKGCRRFDGPEGKTVMTLAQAQAKGLPLCSRCPGSDTQGKGNPDAKPGDEAKPADDVQPAEPVGPAGKITVYHVPGKKRVHVKNCRRFDGPEGKTVMTLAQAQAKGLALCSRCPGSTTQGKNASQEYAKVTQAKVFQSASGLQMPYRLFVPKDYDESKKYPLVLSLHGAGSRGDDNVRHLRPWVAGWTGELVQSKHPCIILMPQCPEGKQWVNTPWKNGSYSLAKVPESQHLKIAKALLDKVIKEKSIDADRVYIMGASMGGFGTWDLVMRYPSLFAAAVPMCGAGDPSQAATIKHMPIWAFHGDADPTVPFAGSRDMIDAIRKAGGTKAKLTTYEGVKHNAYELAWKNRKLIEWMFSQNKEGI